MECSCLRRQSLWERTWLPVPQPRRRGTLVNHQTIKASHCARRTLRRPIAEPGAEAVASFASATISTQSLASQQTDAAAAAAALNPPPAMASFEPQLPDTSVLVAQGLVLALTVAAAGYWWLVVVPSERAALGRSKRLGPLDTYLQELERPEAAQERRLERWFYTDWLQQRQERRERRLQQRQQSCAVADDALPGDSTAREPYDAAIQEDPNLLRPSVPTPEPKFLSLDNPIVTTAVLLLLAAATAALQRYQG